MNDALDTKEFKRVKGIALALKQRGFTCHVVGGFVRDYLDGSVDDSYDIDLVTDALPQQVVEIFPKTIPVGFEHGVVVIVVDGLTFEVATCRKDGEYVGDSRKPSSVEFSTSIEEDSTRRDFTFNAIYLDPITGELFDFHKGIDDLEKNKLSFIGDAQERINEDPLRILRACRFVGSKNASLSKHTKEVLTLNGNKLQELSKERIREELTKILMLRGGRNVVSLRSLDELGLLELVLPSVTDLKGSLQEVKWHPEGDAFEHTLCVMANFPNLVEDENVDSVELAWAVLLHDIGKVNTRWNEEKEKWTSYGHDLEGANLAVPILRDLKFSNKQVKNIVWLIRHHMHMHWFMTLKTSKKLNLVHDENFSRLLDLNRCDDMGRGSASHDGSNEIREWVANQSEEQVAKYTPLITGRDLIREGFEPNASFTAIMGKLKEKTLDGEVTTVQEALDLAKQMYVKS